MRGIIEFRGKTKSDIEIAVAGALSLILQGFIVGNDSTETSSYSFSIEFEEGDQA